MDAMSLISLHFEQLKELRNGSISYIQIIKRDQTRPPVRPVCRKLGVTKLSEIATEAELYQALVSVAQAQAQKQQEARANSLLMSNSMMSNYYNDEDGNSSSNPTPRNDYTPFNTARSDNTSNNNSILNSNNNAMFGHSPRNDYTPYNTARSDSSDISVKKSTAVPGLMMNFNNMNNINNNNPVDSSFFGSSDVGLGFHGHSLSTPSLTSLANNNHLTLNSNNSNNSAMMASSASPLGSDIPLEHNLAYVALLKCMMAIRAWKSSVKRFDLFSRDYGYSEAYLQEVYTALCEHLNVRHIDPTVPLDNVIAALKAYFAAFGGNVANQNTVHNNVFGGSLSARAFSQPSNLNTANNNTMDNNSKQQHMMPSLGNMGNNSNNNNLHNNFNNLNPNNLSFHNHGSQSVPTLPNSNVNPNNNSLNYSKLSPGNNNSVNINSLLQSSTSMSASSILQMKQQQQQQQLGGTSQFSVAPSQLPNYGGNIGQNSVIAGEHLNFQQPRPASRSQDYGPVSVGVGSVGPSSIGSSNISSSTFSSSLSSPLSPQMRSVQSARLPPRAPFPGDGANPMANVIGTSTGVGGSGSAPLSFPYNSTGSGVVGGASNNSMGSQSSRYANSTNSGMKYDQMNSSNNTFNNIINNNNNNNWSVPLAAGVTGDANVAAGIAGLGINKTPTPSILSADFFGSSISTATSASGSENVTNNGGSMISASYSYNNNTNSDASNNNTSNSNSNSNQFANEPEGGLSLSSQSNSSSSTVNNNVSFERVASADSTSTTVSVEPKLNTLSGRGAGEYLTQQLLQLQQDSSIASLSSTTLDSNDGSYFPNNSSNANNFIASVASKSTLSPRSAPFIPPAFKPATTAHYQQQLQQQLGPSQGQAQSFNSQQQSASVLGMYRQQSPSAPAPTPADVTPRSTFTTPRINNSLLTAREGELHLGFMGAGANMGSGITSARTMTYQQQQMQLQQQQQQMQQQRSMAPPPPPSFNNINNSSRLMSSQPINNNMNTNASMSFASPGNNSNMLSIYQQFWESVYRLFNTIFSPKISVNQSMELLSDLMRLCMTTNPPSLAMSHILEIVVEKACRELVDKVEQQLYQNNTQSSVFVSIDCCIDTLHRFAAQFNKTFSSSTPSMSALAISPPLSAQGNPGAVGAGANNGGNKSLVVAVGSVSLAKEFQDCVDWCCGNSTSNSNNNGRGNNVSSSLSYYLPDSFRLLSSGSIATLDNYLTQISSTQMAPYGFSDVFDHILFHLQSVLNLHQRGTCLHLFGSATIGLFNVSNNSLSSSGDRLTLGKNTSNLVDMTALIPSMDQVEYDSLPTRRDLLRRIKTLENALSIELEVDAALLHLRDCIRSARSYLSAQTTKAQQLFHSNNINNTNNDASIVALKLAAKLGTDGEVMCKFGDRYVNSLQLELDNARQQPQLKALLSQLSILRKQLNDMKMNIEDSTFTAINEIAVTLEHASYHNVEVGTTPRDVFVKFLVGDSPAGALNCQLVVGRPMYVHTSRFIAHYCNIDSTGKVRALLGLIKLFASTHEITSEVSVYGWSILALHLLLRFKFIPILLSNNTDVGEKTFCGEIDVSFHKATSLPRTCAEKLASTSLFELLLLFFRYFSDVDVFSNVFTLRNQGDVINKNTLNNYKEKKQWRLCIEDPFENFSTDRPNDLGCNVTMIGQVKLFKIIRQASASLSSIVHCGEANFSKWLIGIFNKSMLLEVAKSSGYNDTFPINVSINPGNNTINYGNNNNNNNNSVSNSRISYNAAAANANAGNANASVRYTPTPPASTISNTTDFNNNINSINTVPTDNSIDNNNSINSINSNNNNQTGNYDTFDDASMGSSAAFDAPPPGFAALSSTNNSNNNNNSNITGTTNNAAASISANSESRSPEGLTALNTAAANSVHISSTKSDGGFSNNSHNSSHNSSSNNSGSSRSNNSPKYLVPSIPLSSITNSNNNNNNNSNNDTLNTPDTSSSVYTHTTTSSNSQRSAIGGAGLNHNSNSNNSTGSNLFNNNNTYNQPDMDNNYNSFPNTERKTFSEDSSARSEIDLYNSNTVLSNNSNHSSNNSTYFTPRSLNMLNNLSRNQNNQNINNLTTNTPLNTPSTHVTNNLYEHHHHMLSIDNVNFNDLIDNMTTGALSMSKLSTYQHDNNSSNSNMSGLSARAGYASKLNNNTNNGNNLDADLSAFSNSSINSNNNGGGVFTVSSTSSGLGGGAGGSILGANSMFGGNSMATANDYDYTNNNNNNNYSGSNNSNINNNNNNNNDNMQQRHDRDVDNNNNKNE